VTSPSASAASSLIFLVFFIFIDSLLLVEHWRAKNFLPIFRWPVTIGINVVDMVWCAIIIVGAHHALIVPGGPRGFVLFGSFVLLLELSEVQYLRLAIFFKIFIQLLECPWTLSGDMVVKLPCVQCLYGLRDDLL
jgi:hypothetical protein